MDDGGDVAGDGAHDEGADVVEVVGRGVHPQVVEPGIHGEDKEEKKKTEKKRKKEKAMMKVKVVTIVMMIER